MLEEVYFDDNSRSGLSGNLCSNYHSSTITWCIDNWITVAISEEPKPFPMLSWWGWYLTRRRVARLLKRRNLLTRYPQGPLPPSWERWGIPWQLEWAVWPALPWKMENWAHWLNVLYRIHDNSSHYSVVERWHWSKMDRTHCLLHFYDCHDRYSNGSRYSLAVHICVHKWSDIPCSWPCRI